MDESKDFFSFLTKNEAITKKVHLSMRVQWGSEEFRCDFGSVFTNRDKSGFNFFF